MDWKQHFAALQQLLQYLQQQQVAAGCAVAQPAAAAAMQLVESQLLAGLHHLLNATMEV